MKIVQKRIFSDEDSERINYICNRLQRSVTSIQVINWLENFEDEEISLALTVLESIRYYTVEDIIYDFDESLKKILNEIPSHEKIFVHGLGEFGKSGSSLIYYLKKTPTFQNTPGRFKILSHVVKLKQQGIKEGSFLLLLDDIIGSGKSLVKYYDHNIKQQLSSIKIEINLLILCLAFMDESMKLLDKNFKNIKIYGTPYKKAFNSGSSVFGYRPKMLPIRNFCYKYGIDLCNIYDRDLKTVVPHPLGYDGTQSLLAFAHSVPNNTLPIIWSSVNNWHPLFPRHSIEKISQAKNFRNETKLWLVTAYNLRIFKIDDTQNKIYFKDLDYKLLAIIRLKKRQSIDPIICQILGISINELDEVLDFGVKTGILDQDKKLSKKGIDIYEDIKKKILISNTEESRKFTTLREGNIYVPKRFLGKT
ncbi:MAG: hypothetical protein REI96_02975 [Flavobacterium nitrogenifigens]|uniref:phosphoribosyltransferase-like protein n=1 Tax=Flavobacterium nitrogenifigens TaxID=1617283 RepID=UPI0028088ECF|nr:hypothetical protein [Flavobacterium nitrogenifigens]MDQ8011387.1 hypothetical protein [Flavobacterium nitrogenifigens]